MPENEVGSIRVGKANWNLIAPVLFEEAVRRGEGKVGAGGANVMDGTVFFYILPYVEQEQLFQSSYTNSGWTGCLSNSSRLM